MKVELTKEQIGALCAACQLAGMYYGERAREESDYETVKRLKSKTAMYSDLFYVLDQKGKCDDYQKWKLFSRKPSEKKDDKMR